MRPIDSLLDAFEVHYSDESRPMKYTPKNRKELVTRYMGISAAYMLAVYDEVTSTHQASLRSLPDTAVLEAAMNRLGRQETYNAPKQIEEQREVNEDLVRHLVAAAVDHGNENERERVRRRVAKGEARVEERWWLHVTDDLGGKWRAMPAGWGTR